MATSTPQVIIGGYPMVASHSQSTDKSVKPVSSHGGPGSLNNSIKQPPPTKTIASSAQVTGQVSDKDVVPGGLNADLAKFNNEVFEITSESTLYPATMPWIANIVVQFPKQIDEGTVVVSAPSQSVLDKDNPAVGGSSSISNIEPSFKYLLDTENLLSLRPNNFLNFSFERIWNGIGRFTLTLFDPKWDAIEKRLIQNKGFFRFKYGYIQGGLTNRPATVSPWYVAKTLNYKVDFGMEGSTLTITGVTTGYSLSFSKTSIALNPKNELISDIALSICKAFGPDYIPIIEKTKPVLSRDGLDVTDQINTLLTNTGSSYLRVIIQELVKYAENEQGQGNYGFFIRTTQDGKNEFHFHTVTYDPKNVNKPAATSSSGDILPPTRTIATTLSQGGQPVATVPGSSTKTIPGFTKFRNKNTALLSFTPSWSMSIAQLTGGGGTTSAIIDMTTKEVSIINADMDSNPQKMDGKPGITKLHAEDYLPEAFKNNQTIKGFKVLNVPSRSAEHHKSVVDADFSRSYPGGIRGTLEILGSPSFYLTQKIAVFIFKPQGDNKVASAGNVHWISGFYRIIKITEKIAAGKYTTVFELISDGRSLVSLDKVKTLQ